MEIAKIIYDFKIIEIPINRGTEFQLRDFKNISQIGVNENCNF